MLLEVYPGVYADSMHHTSIFYFRDFVFGPEDDSQVKKLHGNLGARGIGRLRYGCQSRVGLCSEGALNTSFATGVGLINLGHLLCLISLVAGRVIN